MAAGSTGVPGGAFRSERRTARFCPSCNCTTRPRAGAIVAAAGGDVAGLRAYPLVRAALDGAAHQRRAGVCAAPGDLVTINAGRQDGITVGQEFYTRRPLASSELPLGRDNPVTIRTTGWIRVWAVDDEMSLATITHACETVDVHDYLEPFVLPTVPATSKQMGDPERGNYANVLSGQDRRTQFRRGDYLLIDRGSNQGVTPGARFVMYHDRRLPGHFLLQIGEAVAVDVTAKTCTLHIIDAISTGEIMSVNETRRCVGDLRPDARYVTSVLANTHLETRSPVFGPHANYSDPSMTYCCLFGTS